MSLNTINLALSLLILRLLGNGSETGSCVLSVFNDETGTPDDFAWGWSKNEPLPNICQHLFSIPFLPPYLRIAALLNVNSIC